MSRSQQHWLEDRVHPILEYYVQAFECFDAHLQLYIDTRQQQSRSARMPDTDAFIIETLAAISAMLCEAHDRKVQALDRCEPKAALNFRFHRISRSSLERLNRVAELLRNGLPLDLHELRCNAMLYLYMRAEMVAAAFEAAESIELEFPPNEEYVVFVKAFREMQFFLEQQGEKRLWLLPSIENSDDQRVEFSRELDLTRIRFDSFRNVVEEVPNEGDANWQEFCVELFGGMTPFANSIELARRLLSCIDEFELGRA